MSSMFFEEEENSVSDLASDISPSKRVRVIKRKRNHSNDEDKRALKDIETPSKEQDLSQKKELISLYASVSTSETRQQAKNPNIFLLACC